MNNIRKIIDPKKFFSLPTRTQLKYFKVIFFITLAIITLMNFFSLGVTGSNFMIWKQMQTESMQQIMDRSHKSFFISQQLIIAFDVLCLGVLGLLTFSVFKFYTKGNLIIMGTILYKEGISLLFWVVRWSASIYFLSTDSEIRQQNSKKFNMIYNQSGQLNPLCMAEQCKGQLLNYVECGKILLWKQLSNFQTGYIVITILLGIVLMTVAYKTNQLDVQSQSSQIQLAESN